MKGAQCIRRESQLGLAVLDAIPLQEFLRHQTDVVSAHPQGGTLTTTTAKPKARSSG